MTSSPIYNTGFDSLHFDETVAAATRHMLDRRVSDLPVVDDSGRLLGMFKLHRMLGVLLPRAALLGDGIPDLAFVSDTVEMLCERMREIESTPVHKFMEKADPVVEPATPPIEIVLLLYKGANNIPVVAPDTGKLVGMVGTRDVLVALHRKAT